MGEVMEAEVYRFAPLPETTVKCACCGREMIRHNPGNNPAYCKYGCGATAQPEHVSVAKGWGENKFA